MARFGHYETYLSIYMRGTERERERGDIGEGERRPETHVATMVAMWRMWGDLTASAWAFGDLDWV